MDQEIFELNDELTKLRQKCKSQESGKKIHIHFEIIMFHY